MEEAEEKVLEEEDHSMDALTAVGENLENQSNDKQEDAFAEEI